MKKKVGPLRLNRDTLILLTGDGLKNAAGGYTNYPCPSAKPTCLDCTMGCTVVGCHH
jgi:hypothetical protein